MHKSFWIGFSVVGLALLISATFLVRYALVQRDERNRLINEQKREDIKITIVEGKRREEIAAQLASAGVCSYDDFITASAGSEGRLFPDTYRFFPNTPAQDVVTVLTNTFNKRIASLSSQPLPKGLRSVDEAIIVASIVEREAKTDTERASIAEVYLNRLQIGMKLDADPTTQYAKDTIAYQKSTARQQVAFWGTITRNDYTAVVSPYNTYTMAGLPPGPIANPGLASMKAVYAPQEHDYFYFFHRNGQLYLSKTLTEHEQKLSQF